MVKHIINTRNHLILWHRHGKFRIQDGETRHNVFPKHMIKFQFLFMVGNHSPCIHFGAGTDHSKDASYRYNFTIRFFLLQKILIPWITIIVNGYRKCFCIITAGTATYSKNKVHFTISCDLHPFDKFIRRWIRHNTGNLNNFFPSLFQDIHNLVINAIPLNRAASIHQSHSVSIFSQFPWEKGKCIFSEIQFGGINIRKIT